MDAEDVSFKIIIAKSKYSALIASSINNYAALNTLK